MAKQFPKPQFTNLDVTEIARDIYAATVANGNIRSLEKSYVADQCLEFAEEFVNAVARRELAREVAHDKAQADEELAAAELASAPSTTKQTAKPSDKPVEPATKTPQPQTVKTG